MRLVHVLLAASCLVVLLPLTMLSVAQATVISYPDGMTTKSSKPCAEAPGGGGFPKATCTTEAFFSSTSLDDLNDETISPTFEREFAAWNLTNPADGKWTLQFGGNPNGTFKVRSASTHLGGVFFIVRLDTVALPAPGNNQVLGWTQGLHDNIASDLSKIVAPQYGLDITSKPCQNDKDPRCPPLYPSQYPNHAFFDNPKFPFQPPGMSQAFFEATDYLSLADYTTRTLTVYDGIDYSWYNSVAVSPVPTPSALSSLALLVVAFAGLGLIGRWPVG